MSGLRTGDGAMHIDSMIEETATSNLIWERRHDTRVHCCGERVAWKSERSRRSRKGWLNDVSRLGVSFLIESRRSPSEGETLELRTDKRSEPIAYRVVRVTPEGEDLALVGCERVGVAETPMAMAA